MPLDDTDLAEYEKPFIEKWQLYIGANKAIGKYLTCANPIPTGEVVLELAPVNLLQKEDVQDFNRVIQISATLYSSSLTMNEYNNYICHSCNPNCTLVILPTNTILLKSIRDINPSEVITIDYNETEWDMVEQKVDFLCSCQSDNCCKWVRGKKFINI